MASVRKRRPEDGGGYQVRYYGPDGKLRSKTFSKKADAVSFSNEVEADMARGAWLDPKRSTIPLSEFLECYLESSVHWRPASRIKVQGHVRNYIAPAFGDHALGDIAPVDVRQWVVALGRHGLAAGTVRGIYSSFSRIMNQAVADGLIPRNPCFGVALPQDKVEREPVFLDPFQIARLADTVPTRYKALIFTAAYTGMRWGELAALRVSNLDLERGVIVISEAASEVSGVIQDGRTKTGKTRTVSLPKFLVEMLTEHIGTYASKSHVFTSAEGGRLRRNFYQRDFLPAAKAAGMPPGLRFHDLRHSCAALLIAQGAHPKEIQERLGHSTIRMTFDRYGHLFPTLDQRLSEGLDAAFRETQSKSNDGPLK